MHDKHLYEYAVIRYVPRVEREEFINVGLIMMCKRQRWLRVNHTLPAEKISLYNNGLTLDEINRQLSLFTGVGHGNPSNGPIAALEAEERFRWLTAVKSSCIQTSRPHPGITADLDSEFDRLYSELVL